MNRHSQADVEIVEVGPRDGLQSIGQFVPTSTKLELIDAAIEAGLERIEIGSFVSEKAVSQLRDTPLLLAECLARSKLASQVLVPTKTRAEQAVQSGASWIAYVISVSETHNQANLKRSVEASLLDYQAFVTNLSESVNVRLNVATAFDCPFEGRVDISRVFTLIERALEMRAKIEICLCDTTGRGSPAHVAAIFDQARRQFPSVRSWAFHGHDTYGLGMANVYAAYMNGVRIFDAAFGGLGGCPFAPGATGNVATEDVAYLFHGMGVRTGLVVPKLVELARLAVAIPGAIAGGRVREALAGRPACG